MSAKFFSCSYNQLMEYVKDNNLTEVRDGMHSTWIDTEGKEKASRMHGFAFDEYSICDTPNFETLLFVNNIINKYK